MDNRNATESFEPGILNSNLLPVNANGEVLLRSVVSLGEVWQNVNTDLHLNSLVLILNAVYDSIENACKLVAKEDKIIAGGASLAPSLWSVTNLKRWKYSGYPDNHLQP